MRYFSSSSFLSDKSINQNRPLTNQTIKAHTQKGPFSSIRYLSWLCIKYTGISVIVIGSVVTAFFVYDATTYRASSHIEDLHVPKLALSPEKGGPKNLPIAKHLVDSEDFEESSTKNKPRLVILGSGWAATTLLKTISAEHYHVTVISPVNYFLFTPLLPSATVGTIEMRSLIEPIRRITNRIRAHFLEATAEDIVYSEQLVEVSERDKDGNERRFYVPYDKLVVAVGSQSNEHGVKGLEYCNSLKTIQDAVNIRQKIIGNFERACLPSTTEEERKKLLSFVVCGGGPTGVEFCAELYDMINEDLGKYFPKILRNQVSVHIIQSRDHLLNTYDEYISQYAEGKFQRDQIDVITNARVQQIDDGHVYFSQKQSGGDAVDKELPYGLCLWSTGVSLVPITRKIVESFPQQKNRHAIETDSHLRVIGAPLGTVYAIGDCSTVQNNLADHIVEFLQGLDASFAENPTQAKLDYKKMRLLMSRVKRKYPQANAHLRRLDKLFSEYDKDKSGHIDYEELHSLLENIDSRLTSLPATAQRAHQQGTYLGKKLEKLTHAAPALKLNDIQDGDIDDAISKGFEYRHLGSLAYLGNSAVVDLNGKSFVGGLIAMYMWRSVYWSEQVSFRTRSLIAVDWAKRAIWGRDISTI